METYKNEKHLQKEIIEDNNHQLIYAKDDYERTIFLKELEQKYPVKINRDTPMAMYLNDYGFTNNNVSNIADIDKISMEYLNLLIVREMLIKSKKDIGFHDLNNRITHMLYDINMYNRHGAYPYINNLDALIVALSRSKEIYMKFNRECQDKNILNGLPIHDIDLKNFTDEYKVVLDNNSYIAMLIDHRKKIAIPSVNAIDDLITTDINNNVSIKIVTEEGKWPVGKVLSNNIIKLENKHTKVLRKTK